MIYVSAKTTIIRISVYMKTILSQVCDGYLFQTAAAGSHISLTIDIYIYIYGPIYEFNSIATAKIETLDEFLRCLCTSFALCNAHIGEL